MAGLSPATSPSFVSKAESVSNLTNVYDLETLGAGRPEPARLVSVGPDTENLSRSSLPEATRQQAQTGSKAL